MSISYPFGSNLAAQSIFIQVCGPIFTGATPALADPAGNPLSVSVTGAFPANDVQSPSIQVTVEEGEEYVGNDYGRVGLDPSGQYWVHLVRYPNARAVFTVYTPEDVLRRFLVGWLRHGIRTAYSIDAATGQRIDSAVLRALRHCQIHPLLKRLFEPPEYPPPNLTEPRPKGLPWRATLRMNCSIQVLWTSAPTIAGGTVILSPTTPPDGFTPLTIPVPVDLSGALT